jgi:hypothetical protein
MTTVEYAGHQKLIIMTPIFDVLTEGPFNTAEFRSGTYRFDSILPNIS